jgi:hypothetical protein
MKRYSDIMTTWRLRRGISLIELVIAVMIGSMVLGVVFVVYSHARRNVAAMSASLERDELSGRILQLIAQDMDRFLVDTGDVRIELQPMQFEGLVSARLIMKSTLYDNQMQAKPYETIVWEARYDIPTQSLILYRGHSGIVSEDKLLESQRTDEEREKTVLVPLCDGLTHFRIMAVVNGNPRNAYISDALPQQFVVSISFAEPQKEGNEYVIPEEYIVTRTIAVNRSRTISYIFTEPNLAEPNVPDDAAEPNEPAGDS